ncbi:MAG: cell division protein FtsL [Archangiaceae bacterium]|nr:cell division protein FtsL [Archangiaceae bacterium]
MSTGSVELRARGALPFSVIFLELLPAALAIALLAAVGVVHVTSRVLVVKVGYELSKLDQESTALTRDNDRLKLELATLKSPARLESQARTELGMGPPAASSIIHLGKKR